MSSRGRRLAALLLAGGPLTLALRAARAQEPAAPPGPPVTTSAVLGMRDYMNPLAALDEGKLEEYRDLRSGAVVQGFQLLVAPRGGPRLLRVEARDVGLRDQAIWLRGGELGRFDLQLHWDRVPHTYSTTARLPGVVPSAGVFALPAPRPDTATLNRTPYSSPVRSQWDPVRVSLRYTPTAAWDLEADFTRIDKSGTRPMGMAFGSPGNNFREIEEPLDQVVDGVKLSESYSGRRAQLRVSYDLSVFQNGLGRVIADNPLQATDSPTSGAASGRTALAPGNVAQTAALTGGVTLPFRTRLTAFASYGWRRQHAAFLPATDNSAITSPALDSIPHDLAADARTSLLSFSATSRPLSPFTIAARYRRYALRDHTAALTLPAVVVNDRTLDTAPEAAVRYPFTKDNADASLGWRPATAVALTAGLAWERWDRADRRNVGRLSERSPRLALDLTPADWLLLRTTVSKAWRRGEGYKQILDDELPELRRFDQANRDRSRVDLLAQLTPRDQLGITATYALGRDEYPASLYGLQSDHNAVIGGDVTWTPTPRLSVGASYTREDYRNRQRSRYREPTTLSNTTYDWVARSNDRITTIGADVSATLLPERLELSARLDYSRAALHMLAANPTAPTGGTASQIRSATASDFPEITQELYPVSVALTYRLAPDWSLMARYLTESYDQVDFRSAGLRPATGADLFLGNDYRDYTAQILTITIGYRPRFLGTGRSSL